MATSNASLSHPPMNFSSGQKFFMAIYLRGSVFSLLLPPRASEQGNVIGSVRIYIYICVQKKIVIERTRDLIYLKFVATDFFPKIISPSAGENSGDLA